MTTQDNLNAEILKLTLVIRSEFPELLKFLNEMPVTIPTEKHPDMDTVVLQEYYNSLYDLLLKYAPNHSCLIKNK